MITIIKKKSMNQAPPPSPPSPERKKFKVDLEASPIPIKTWINYDALDYEHFDFMNLALPKWRYKRRVYKLRAIKKEIEKESAALKETPPASNENSNQSELMDFTELIEDAIGKHKVDQLIDYFNKNNIN